MGYPSNKLLFNMIQNQKNKELEKIQQSKKKVSKQPKPLSLLDGSSSSSDDTDKEDQGQLAEVI